MKNITVALLIGLALATATKQASAGTIYHSTAPGDVICPTSSDMATMAATMRHVEKKIRTLSAAKANQLLSEAIYRANYMGCAVVPNPFDFTLSKVLTKHVPRVVSQSKFGDTTNPSFYVGDFKMAYGNYYSATGDVEHFYIRYSNIAPGSLSTAGIPYTVSKTGTIACADEDSTSQVNHILEKHIPYAGLPDLLSQGNCRKLPVAMQFRALSFDNFSPQSGISDQAYGVQIIKGLPPVFFYVLRSDISPAH